MMGKGSHLYGFFNTGVKKADSRRAEEAGGREVISTDSQRLSGFFELAGSLLLNLLRGFLIPFRWVCLLRERNIP